MSRIVNAIFTMQGRKLEVPLVVESGPEGYPVEKVPGFNKTFREQKPFDPALAEKDDTPTPIEDAFDPNF